MALEGVIFVPRDNSKYVTELQRIGNNINQIAKKANQGYFKVYNFEQTNQELRNLWILLRKQIKYGNN